LLQEHDALSTMTASQNDENSSRIDRAAEMLTLRLAVSFWLASIDFFNLLLGWSNLKMLK
jgi:hypothetical protein